MSNNNNSNLPRIATAVRVRPPLPNEDLYFNVIQRLNLVQMGGSMVPYNADYLFGTGHSQESVFVTAAMPLLDKFIKAEENVSIVSFGPNYSGRTYTVFGPSPQVIESAMFYGIYPRLATHLFSEFDAASFSGNDPAVKVYVTFFEVNQGKIIDLLTQTYVPTEPDIQIKDISDLTTYKVCKSARQMMECLHLAMGSKKSPAVPSHLCAKVILCQPASSGASGGRLTSSALFLDIGSSMIEHPMMRGPNTLPLLVPEDRFVLRALANFAGRAAVEYVMLPEINHLWNLLKPIFTGEKRSLMIYCMPPNSIQINDSLDYLMALTTIYDMRQQSDSIRNNDVLGARATESLHQADLALNQLSISSDEALNAQSHGLLECIEEVTESEEEIASSDERMSESPVSLDNSLSESDQEECNSKACRLSDNNFFSNLDNMCNQFYAFVDTFVDSFKAKTSGSPAKESKRDYAATRRGALSELMRVDDVNAKADAFCNFLVVPPPPAGSGRSNEANSQESNKEGNEGPSSSRGPVKRRQVDAGAQEAALGLLSRPLAWGPINDADHPIHPRYLEWSRNDRRGLRGFDLEKWVDRTIEDLQDVRLAVVENLRRTANETIRGNRQREPIQVTREKIMFYGLSTMEPIINQMKNAFLIGGIDLNHLHPDFDHMIRWRRQGREIFVSHKTALESSVKSNVASRDQLRDYILAEEMVATLDICIEYLNYINLHGEPMLRASPVTHDMALTLKGLTSIETTHLLFKYIMKIVDLLEAGKQADQIISDHDRKLEMANRRISALTREVHDLRTELSQQQQQAVTQYKPPADAPCSSRAPAPAPSHIALPEGSRDRRGPSIPQQNLRQLQVNQAAPPAKVTIKHNKVIIEKPSDKK